MDGVSKAAYIPAYEQVQRQRPPTVQPAFGTCIVHYACDNAAPPLRRNHKLIRRLVLLGNI